MGSGSGFGSVVEPINERLCKFILAEVTHGILDATLVFVVTIKEGIMELMDEWLRYFRAEIATRQIGARTSSSREFKAYGAPEFFRSKDLIASRHWISDMENAQQTTFCLEGEKVVFASYLLRNRE